MADDKNLVWIDMEMSGLSAETDKILEIASVITDSNLNTIAIGPELVISQPESLFDTMDNWNQKHHKKSGLWEKVLESDITVEKGELDTLQFIQKHCMEGKSPLCGNTIYQDRKFLSRYMPKVDSFLHYRLIDVSSIKELASRWYPNLQPRSKKNNHRALDDIQESIEELKFFRETVFKSST